MQTSILGVFRVLRPCRVCWQGAPVCVARMAADFLARYSVCFGRSWRGRNVVERCRAGAAANFAEIRRGLGETTGSKGGRRIDPLWAMVLLAGVLAALALAEPQWRMRAGDDPPALNPDWSVRSSGTAEGGGRGEAWIRLAAPENTHVDAVSVDGVRQPVSAAELAAGITAPVAATPAKLALLSSGKVLAAATFERPPMGRTFGFLRLRGPAAGDIDPALQRFFAIQPGVQIDDAGAQPCVVVAKGGNFSAAELAGASFVIAEPDAELPGIKLGARLVAGSDAPASWTPEPVSGGTFAWPPFVSLKDVHVKALREAELSPEWEVVARAGGHPWIAVRRQESLWIWLASEPATDTDWVQSGGGFVAFFGEMEARALGSGGTPAFVEWSRLPAKSPQPASIIPLQRFAGGAAIALLMLASFWHIKRRAAFSSVPPLN